MMEQAAQFAVLGIFDDVTGGERGNYGDGDFRGRVGGEMVEVYSFVGAAGCEDYFLGLVGDGRGGG